MAVNLPSTSKKLIVHRGSLGGHRMGRGDSLFYKKVFSLLRRSESEVLAYRLVYEAVNASGRFPELASSLEAAKHAVRCAMEAKYEAAIEKLSAAQSEQEILQLLETLDPQGAPN